MLAALFIACGNTRVKETEIILDGGSSVRTVCLKGVTYYLLYRGIAVALDTNSKVILCK